MFQEQEKFSKYKALMDNAQQSVTGDSQDESNQVSPPPIGLTMQALPTFELLTAGTDLDNLNEQEIFMDQLFADEDDASRVTTPLVFVAAQGADQVQKPFYNTEKNQPENIGQALVQFDNLLGTELADNLQGVSEASFTLKIYPQRFEGIETPVYFIEYDASKLSEHDAFVLSELARVAKLKAETESLSICALIGSQANPASLTDANVLMKFFSLTQVSDLTKDNTLALTEAALKALDVSVGGAKSEDEEYETEPEEEYDDTPSQPLQQQQPQQQQPPQQQQSPQRKAPPPPSRTVTEAPQHRADDADSLPEEPVTPEPIRKVGSEVSSADNSSNGSSGDEEAQKLSKPKSRGWGLASIGNAFKGLTRSASKEPSASRTPDAKTSPVDGSEQSPKMPHQENVLTSTSTALTPTKLPVDDLTFPEEPAPNVEVGTGLTAADIDQMRNEMQPRDEDAESDVSTVSTASSAQLYHAAGKTKVPTTVIGQPLTDSSLEQAEDFIHKSFPLLAFMQHVVSSVPRTVSAPTRKENKSRDVLSVEEAISDKASHLKYLIYQLENVFKQELYTQERWDKFSEKYLEAVYKGNQYRDVTGYQFKAGDASKKGLAHLVSFSENIFIEFLNLALTATAKSRFSTETTTATGRTALKLLNSNDYALLKPLFMRQVSRRGPHKVLSDEPFSSDETLSYNLMQLNVVGSNPLPASVEGMASQRVVLDQAPKFYAAKYKKVPGKLTQALIKQGVFSSNIRAEIMAAKLAVDIKAAAKAGVTLPNNTAFTKF